MDRKDFIKTCGYACLGGWSLIAFASALPAQAGTQDGEFIKVKHSDFMETKKEKVIERNFLVLRSDKTEFPIYLSKFPERQYTALLMECTHKGCELNAEGEFLVCPCHGSEFSNKGEVLNPPAEQNLRSYNVTTDEKYIYIHL